MKELGQYTAFLSLHLVSNGHKGAMPHVDTNFDLQSSGDHTYISNSLKKKS